MLWLAYVLCLTATAQDRPAGDGVNLYSREKEAALGSQLAADLHRRTTAFENAGFRDYVEQLGARLASHMPEPRFSYSFAAITDDLGEEQEPVSLPGGWIFVSARLILETRYEGEFVGMLAHAMAHSAERHGIPSAARGGNQDQIPLIFMGGWTRTGAWGTAIPMRFRELHRKLEIEADTVAARTLAAARYDPEYLVGYLRRTGAGEERIASLAQVTVELRQAGLSTNPDQDFTRLQDEVRRAFPARVTKPPSLLVPPRLVQ